MDALILSIGTELTQGRLVDTNAAWLARRLRELGLAVVGAAVVPDDLDRLARAIAGASREADVVVGTGGLGPTRDDLTRDAAARAAGVDLVEDAASLAFIEEIFRRFKREMPPNNRLQALFPRGAEVLPNDRGTAPGFAIAIGRARFFLMPGVPHEMYAMYDREVVPRLRAAGAGGEAVEVALYPTYGLSESKVDELLKDLCRAPGDPELAMTAKDGVITVSLTARGATPEAARNAIAAAEANVRDRLGRAIFGRGDETLEQATGRLLLERGATVALAESCTGGLATSLLAKVPGISKALRGGVVAYSNDAKASLLGVSTGTLERAGAVSAETALEMARGAAKALGARLGIGITGVAGPSGGTPEKPVGLVYVAIAGEAGEQAKELRLLGDRERVQRFAALAALNLVRHALLAAPG